MKYKNHRSILTIKVENKFYFAKVTTLDIEKETFDFDIKKILKFLNANKDYY